MRTVTLFLASVLFLPAANAQRTTVTGTVEHASYSLEELRPGARIAVTGTSSPDQIEASAIDVKVKVADVITDALLGPSKTVIGRFAVREAKTEYFSLNVGNGNYVRVEAKSAYGPHGRVRVSDLRSGDLVELRGTWKKPNELHATYMRVMTDEEPSGCRSQARDEAEEKKFLAGEQ